MLRLNIFVSLLFLLSACDGSEQHVPKISLPEGELSFLGSDSCADCHRDAYDEWTGSHHQLAMQVANDSSVLGDFNDRQVGYFSTSTEMFRDGDKYFMRTQNSDGKPEAFEVSYTFGVEPLQQYLTDFPDGRKQVLPFAWDTRPEEVGGQRWFHLHPDEEILFDDELHWTGRLANWNFTCAECHSTNLQEGFDLASNRFATTWSEVSVGCEACHGPGSEHVAQASTGFDQDFGLLVDLDDLGDANWHMNPDTGIAERSKAHEQQQQTESCGQCHSRRAPITDEYEYGKPLLDTHRLSLLREGLYHADGRILDEVFVYGSFVQSKMYRAGVTCTDCHNPHSGELVTGPDPNMVCAQCHLPDKFASVDHAPNNNCVACHMQDEVYMGVDARRDHSFRLPNTASDPDHYGAAIRKVREHGATPGSVFNDDYPAIATATLVSLISAPFDEQERQQLEQAVKHRDPLVRLAGLQAMQNAAPDQRPLIGTELLFDPVRAVRIQAAQVFVMARDLLSFEAARAFPAAAEEFRKSMLATASQPESVTVLAEFEFRMGDNSAAIAYLDKVVQIDPDFALARHSYGLALVRDERYADALIELGIAARLAPDNPRYVYVYAAALNQLGHVDKARDILRQATKDFPGDQDIRSFWSILTTD